jgi:hypothetical protein
MREEGEGSDWKKQRGKVREGKGRSEIKGIV